MYYFLFTDGMSDDFDMVALETVNNAYLGGDTSLACSAETQAQIDQLVVDLVKKHHQKAYALLREHRQKLDEIAQYLHEKETITGEEFITAACINRTYPILKSNKYKKEKDIPSDVSSPISVSFFRYFLCDGQMLSTDFSDASGSCTPDSGQSAHTCRRTVHALPVRFPAARQYDHSTAWPYENLH